MANGTDTPSQKVDRETNFLDNLTPTKAIILLLLSGGMGGTLPQLFGINNSDTKQRIDNIVIDIKENHDNNALMRAELNDLKSKVDLLDHDLISCNVRNQELRDRVQFAESEINDIGKKIVEYDIVLRKYIEFTDMFNIVPGQPCLFDFMRASDIAENIRR